MASAVENFTFNELPRRLVVDSSLPTGTSLTSGWVLVASGLGFQAIPADPSLLGFEPTVAPATGDPTTKYYRGDKTWQTLDAAAVGAIASSEKGTALGVATLDADGYVLLSQMNPSVVERVVIVADEAARYALTTLDVQNGDVVNQQSPLPATMWFVVDQNNLDSSAGYLPFSAGVAASVAWSGITGKPATIGDLEDISLAAEGDLIQFVSGNWVKVNAATLKTSLSIQTSDVSGLDTALGNLQSKGNNLTAVTDLATDGIMVMTNAGTGLAAVQSREITVLAPLEVTNGTGVDGNPNISLGESEVTAGTYGDDLNYATFEVTSKGLLVDAGVRSIERPSLIIPNATVDYYLSNRTRHVLGVAGTYGALSLILPAGDTLQSGSWVEIIVNEDLVEFTDSVIISATGIQSVNNVSSINLVSYGLYPGSRIYCVYEHLSSEWVVTVNNNNTFRSLTIVNPASTDFNESHLIESAALQPRTVLLPDADVDLTNVAQAASTSTDGYLTSTDWNAFDRKLKTINHTSAGTITLVPGYKVTQIISTAATMTLTGGIATDQSEIVRIIARLDTTITLSSPLVIFANGHSEAGSLSTMTLYRGQTVDLVQPVASGLSVHGSHIQISGDTVGSFSLYKPATNIKVIFDMSTVAGDKVITIPNNSVNLGDPYVGYFSDWPYGYDLSSVSFATSARVTGAQANGTSGVIIDLKGVALAQGILGDIARTHPTTMPSARYSLIGATAADLNITGLAAPEFIEVVNTSAASTVKLTRTGTTSYFTDWSTNWVTADTYTFSLGIGEKLFVHPANSSTSCRVSRSGDIVIYPDNRTVNFRSRFIAPTPFTANWTITVPNANVNLGDLPSVATTNNNALSGTRTFCLMGGGGSVALGNKVQGTDTGAIGSTGCDMRGTRNVAYSSTRVGTDAAATDNSFYNCSSTQPAELVTTIGVRYENCTYVQLRNTVTWPNYSRVVGSGYSYATSTVVYTRLSAINLNSTPQDMTTGGAGGNTEVIASLGIYTTALHDIVVIFTDINSSGDPKSIFQRRVAVDAAGGIISNTTPVPDIVIGSTVYTLSISVVSGKLRLTVQSNISTSSACNAEVISRYF